MNHLEAHEIKNNDSQTSVAVRMLSGHFRWVVTGTPLHKCGNIHILLVLMQVLIVNVPIAAPTNYIPTWIFSRYQWDVITRSS